MNRYEHSADHLEASCAPFGCHLSGFVQNVILFSGCDENQSTCTFQPTKLHKIPVRDHASGVDFINAQCTMCNGVTDGTVWPSTIQCKTIQALPNKNGNYKASVIGTDDFIRFLEETNNCKLIINSPRLPQRPFRQCIDLDNIFGLTDDCLLTTVH